MKKGNKVKLKSSGLMYLIDDVIICKNCNREHLKLVNHSAVLTFPRKCYCKTGLNIPVYFTTYDSTLFELMPDNDLEISDILKKLNL